MKPDQIKITDQSEDRKYFTTIPNFIVDQADMEAQSLYLIMKRVAGENGSCYMSERTLREHMGAGKIAMKKALAFLIDQGWIMQRGVKPIETNSGKQEVKVYVVVDVWKKNIDHFHRISTGMTKTDDLGMMKMEDLPETAHQRPAENGSRGLLKSAPKKNPNTKKNPIDIPAWVNAKAWALWLEYKKQRKQKMTPLTISRQIAKLDSDRPNHVAMIERSIENGWTTLYPLKKGAIDSDYARAHEKHLRASSEAVEAKEAEKDNDALRKIHEDMKNLAKDKKL